MHTRNPIVTAIMAAALHAAQLPPLVTLLYLQLGAWRLLAVMDSGDYQRAQALTATTC